MSMSAGSLSPAAVLVQEESNGVISPPAVRTKEGRKYDEVVSLLARLVKEERQGDNKMSPAGRLNEKPEAVFVKEEPEWDDAGVNLYAENDVTSDLVLGPVRLQPQDIAYAPRCTQKRVCDDGVVQEKRVRDNQMSPAMLDNENTEADCNGAMALPTVCVKEEPEWEDVGDCSASEDLYAEHDVTSDLVLGPVRLQPQDITYAPEYLKTADTNQVTVAARSTPNQHEVTKHPCPVCLKKFKSQPSLRCHMRVHGKIKQNYDDFGRKKANVQKNTLKEDIKIKMGKIYSCNVCDKFFVAKHTFLKHKQIGSQCWFLGT